MFTLETQHKLKAISLSFLVPGLGDAYCNHLKKALAFFIMVFVCFVIELFTGYGVALYTFLWLIGLVSANVSTRDYPKHLKLKRRNYCII